MSKFWKNFKSLFIKNSTNNKVAAEEEINSRSLKPIILKDIRGGQLLFKDSGILEADRHFQGMQAAWETKLLNKNI